MKNVSRKVPCYLVEMLFSQKLAANQSDAGLVGERTETSLVVPYRVGRYHGGTPLKIHMECPASAFEWIAVDGVLETLDLSEKSLAILNAKLMSSKGGLAVRQTQGAFVPGLDTLLQPFLFFQLKSKRA